MVLCALCCSHATHDLFNNIAKGNFPEWKFQVQTLDPAEQLNFDFDPLDATKVRGRQRCSSTCTLSNVHTVR